MSMIVDASKMPEVTLQVEFASVVKSKSFTTLLYFTLRIRHFVNWNII